MSVPEEVRAAALAAFSHRSASTRVLPLLWDSFLADRDLHGASRREDRTLRFGDDRTSLRVEVAYGAPVATLLVDVRPTAHLTVELVTPRPEVRLTVSSAPPVELFITARGPVSLLVTLVDGGGSSSSCSTSWVVL
ncbi:MAG: hypothetical protein JWN17_1829 [Frankiales bacterium]|nr:hypothetical protein [Frankiales bacterium]